MATVNLSLPDVMKEWVETQTRTGRYIDASDYLRDLIRRDQEHADAAAELQRLVSEGIESGVSDRSMSELVQTARQQTDPVPSG